ncbi:MAG: hypothetical protein NZ841_03445 [Dictyoglomus sp.]|nr:hypothetical protein [Dictyoglomus sp.]MCX7942247.1 hypothetical protein [Dictyoglomaceae bacterium]MDW8188334.1 hypothetical protein [Dictyoglomus sp.]
MDIYRPILVILFWGLILEILVLIYYLIQGRYPFEFYLNLVVMAITIIGLIYILRRMKREFM